LCEQIMNIHKEEVNTTGRNLHPLRQHVGAGFRDLLVLRG
jgi:hypothetical protein